MNWSGSFTKPIRKIFYNITITSISVAVALIIGTIELIGVLAGQAKITTGPLAAITHICEATTVNGLTVDEAVIRYHDERDLVSRQYALLTPGTRPRCPAQNTIVPRLVPAFVNTFIRLLDVVEISEDDRALPDDIDPSSFLVPDMTCKHCQVIPPRTRPDHLSGAAPQRCPSLHHTKISLDLSPSPTRKMTKHFSAGQDQARRRAGA